MVKLLCNLLLCVCMPFESRLIWFVNCPFLVFYCVFCGFFMVCKPTIPLHLIRANPWLKRCSHLCRCRLFAEYTGKRINEKGSSMEVLLASRSQGSNCLMLETWICLCSWILLYIRSLSHRCTPTLFPSSSVSLVCWSCGRGVRVFWVGWDGGFDSHTEVWTSLFMDKGVLCYPAGSVLWSLP